MVDDIRADQAAYIQIRMAMHKIENRTEDGTLIVLKGHLVLEELIRAKVEAAVQDPAALRKANLTFYNVLCVARAIYGPLPDGTRENPHDLWDVVEAWNTLRNRLACRIAMAAHLVPPIALSRRGSAGQHFANGSAHLCSHLHSLLVARAKGSRHLRSKPTYDVRAHSKF
jgi:hypothetical protein